MFNTNAKIELILGSGQTDVLDEHVFVTSRP